MRVPEFVDDGTDGLTGRIIGAAITVHRHFGPGLLESPYERCFESELRHLGMRVRRQVPLPLIYRDVHVDCAYRLDLLVNDRVVVEVKVVEKLTRRDVAQVVTYLSLAKLEVGLLFNFNAEALMAGGFKRVFRPRGGLGARGRADAGG